MNRLAKETSPYLLQHKDNPVDWYPWGEEALLRARVENKPILLSIGYSACHWCHVMEHESFENPEIARMMNERFVNIKVDREERPDLDHIYQNVAQALTRGGGWPLTVFLTPALEPYFGGTYFPPEDRYGRAGFPRVLESLSQAYRQDPQGVAENAQKLTAFIRGMDRMPGPGLGPADAPPDFRALEAAAQRVASGFDPLLGGLAGAPKFPNPLLLSFLARFSQLTADGAVGEVLYRTLDRMASGGIFDQLGGGFHRYSVDETWSVPHFEKMLYDNGLLLRVYSEALLLGGEALDPSRRELYLRTLRMTIEYLLREMRAPEGAFYAAQDADSEGVEGKFFAWTPAQLRELAARGALSEEGARAFALRFGVTDEGNFEHGSTVLYLARTPAEVAKALGMGSAAASALLDEASRAVFAERARRVAPATDRKILASWNGLAISGLAWAAQALRLNAARALGERAGDAGLAARALEAAKEAFDCALKRMGRPEGRLFSTLQEGSPKLNAYLDDYAFLAMAALDLTRFGDDDRLRQSREWIDVILSRFGDPGEPGYFFTSEDHEALIHRPKTLFDQAIPSGTSVALSVMLALGELLEDGSRYAQEAVRQLRGVGGLAEKAPLGLGELLCAGLLAERGPVTVQGSGAPNLCRNPMVFRKPGKDAASLQICHRGTCLRPEPGAEKAEKLLRERLGISRAL